MRKTIAIVLSLILAAAFSGCDQQKEGSTSQATTPAPSATTEPDFSDTDFSGHWAVSAVYDSAGDTVSESKMKSLGGFTLELLTDGTYFVYDESGAVLGQGSYTVNKNVMALSAGGVQTIYTVMDKDTLRGAATDGSVTVLTRQPEETPAIDDGDQPDDDTGDGTDVSGQPDDTDEDTDIPDDSAEPSASATPGASASATSTPAE